MRSHVSPQRAVALTLVLLAGMAGALAIFVVPAVAAREHIFNGTFGEPCTVEPCPPGKLKEPSAVAVSDATGEIYVLDQGDNRVEGFSSAGIYEAQFDGSGTPAKAFAFGSEPLTAGIAIDNSTNPLLDPSAGDIYVTDSGHKVLDKFSPSGSYLGQLAETTGGSTFGELYGVAVDPSGLVWVYQSSGEIDSYNNALGNEFQSALNSPGFGTGPGFAVDSEDNLYVNQATKHVAKLNSGGGMLKEEVDQEETSAAAVDLSTNDVYLDNLTTAASFTASEAPVERFGSGDLTGGSGIGVNGSSGAVYIADSSTDRVDAFVLEPPEAPVIAGESISKVTGESATFQAEVDPHGADTEYHFEYGQCTAPSACSTSGYEQSLPSPDGSIGSEFAVQDVVLHAQGLRASTAYHFRVVARNEFGVVQGAESTFTTQGLGVSALPDGRSWEMVSPPQKEGAQLGWIEEGIVQASADGDAISDWATAPTEGMPAGNSNDMNVFYGRGPSGWISHDIAPAHSRATGASVGGGNEYRYFSEDLSVGVVQPFGSFTPLSPDATESTPYLHSEYLNGSPGEPCLTNCYTPLVSSANVPSGMTFGEEPNGKCESLTCGPEFMGASPDAKHIVLESPVALTSASAAHGGLYEWNGGDLQLVSLLPAGETNREGGDAAENPALGFEKYSARNTISENGSRIIWTSANNGRIYLRDTQKSETIPLSLQESAKFETASTDDSKVFFTEGSALYEYNLNDPVGGRLTNLTIDQNAGERPGVAEVIGASNDGSYVYFTAAGVLAPGAVPGQCIGNLSESGKNQLCNLYLSHNGRTTFIADLSAEDSPDWSTNLNQLPARVSPDGQWLAFMSNRNLTGYDTTDALSGHADEEVYLYDANTNKLVCASCNPTGARPVGVEYGSEGGLVKSFGVFARKTWIASNVPPWTGPDGYNKTRYQSRYLSNSGRLFFDSHDALVPQDVNGTQDVYEFEPPGVGDCGRASSTFSERSGGCVAAISSGISNEESAFLDASATGGDVFFLTAAKLLPQDFDNALDIYDARECSEHSCIEPPPAVPPPCDTGDGCKAAPSPQPEIFGAPASATFSGAGNVAAQAVHPVVQVKPLTRAQKLASALKVCRHERGKRRLRCERRARTRYGAKQSHKANATKGGKR